MRVSVLNEEGNLRVPHWAVLLAVFAVGVAITATRRPDALYNPQFAYEDGLYWYGEAHELGGLRALFLPYRGYLVVGQRLAGWFAQAFPLEWAPLVLNCLAIAIGVLPAVFICTNRFATAVPRLSVRLVLAFIYLALPQTRTLFALITNCQWHLGSLAGLIVAAEPDRRRAWRVFDVVAIVLSGLSGPFAILLAPVAGLKWWLRRDRWTLVQFLLALATAAAQIVSVLLAVRAKPAALGASVAGFLEIVARRVVFGALLGNAGHARLIADSSVLLQRWALIAVALCGLALLIAAAVKGPLGLRLFILYAALVLMASLVWPPPGAFSAGYWERLLVPDDRDRYFHLMVLAFFAALVWLLSTGPAAARAVAALVLGVALVFGVRLDWREAPLPDLQFQASVAKYKQAAKGQKVLIPYPPGWGVTLTKK